MPEHLVLDGLAGAGLLRTTMKKITRHRLALQKETVRALDREELAGANGGIGVGFTTRCTLTCSACDSYWPCSMHSAVDC